VGFLAFSDWALLLWRVLVQSARSAGVRPFALESVACRPGTPRRIVCEMQINAVCPNCGGVACPTARRGHVLLQFACSRKRREIALKFPELSAC
jgi:hypothetical protein